MMPNGTVVQMAICKFWLKLGRTPLKSGTSHKITASTNQPTKIVVALISAVTHVDVISDVPPLASLGTLVLGSPPELEGNPPAWDGIPPPAEVGKLPPGLFCV